MSVNYKPKSDGMFDRIESEGEALRTIKVVTGAFFAVTAVQAVLVFFVSPILVVVPAIFAGLALAVRLGRSRAAAYILTGLTVLNVGSQVYATIVTGRPPFAGFAIAVVLGWCSIRAVQATSALVRLRNAPGA